jgi:hypothetical protein
MFTETRTHAKSTYMVLLTKVKVTLRSKVKIVFALYLQEVLKDFYETWISCSPIQCDVENPLQGQFPEVKVILRVKGQSSKGFEGF